MIRVGVPVTVRLLLKEHLSFARDAVSPQLFHSPRVAIAQSIAAIATPRAKVAEAEVEEGATADRYYARSQK